MTVKRVLVMGLDCLAPELAFEKYLDEMPTVKRLLASGTWGEMHSTEPPITVPAWMAMATSQDPGSLGVYGFRHRKNNSYTTGWTANATTFDRPTVWDILAEQGKKVCLVGFPPSYPTRPVNGWQVGCFLTPGKERPFTHPPELAAEINQVAPDYQFDVPFRIDSRAQLLKNLYAMTKSRFQVIRHLMQTKPWDLFWFVEIGTDRIAHAFWKYADPNHPMYQKGHEFEHAIREYYRYVDTELGELLKLVDDDTAVLLVSDHGAKGMRGAFCINQWLAEKGYLTLRSQPKPGTTIEKCDIDWTRTKAWAWGGYYARVFLNVEGREPSGAIPQAEYETVLAELSEEIRNIRDHEGKPLDNRVYRPHELYRKARGDAPDLMVYLDNLSWRSAGTLGWESLYLFENDTGPDDAVHAHNACFVLRAPGRTPRGRIEGLRIYDVAPTILDLFGLKTPESMEGAPCE